MSDRVTKGGGRATDLTFMARLVSGVKFIIGGKDPVTDPAQVPFGPGQPLQPVFQPQMRGRQYDYLQSTNLQYVPRQEEAISFSELRGLADNYDLLRLVIETVKDEVGNVNWIYVNKDKTKKKDARCDFITEFMEYPDKEHPFKTWIRPLLEDYLVIDAMCLYPRPTLGGQLYALEHMDGALIKRYLDAQGRTPAPPQPAYAAYIKGVPAVDYCRPDFSKAGKMIVPKNDEIEELLYFPRNIRTNHAYGYSKVEQVIMTVNIAIRRQLHQLSYYTDGNAPDLLFGCPVEWNAEQIKIFQTWWDSLMAGNVEERRRGKFIPGGVEPYDVKAATLKDEYDEWLARIICYCFSKPPTPFIKQMNRATADTSKEAAEEEGIVPTLSWLKSFIDMIIYRYFGWRDIEALPEFGADVDPQVQAEIDKIYLQEYVKTPEEVREGLGLEGPAPEKPLPPMVGQPSNNGGNSDGNFNDNGSVASSGSANGGADISGNGKGSGSGAAKKKQDDADVKKIERAKKKSFEPIDRTRAAVLTAQGKLTRMYTAFLQDQAPEIATQVQTAVEALHRGASDVSRDTQQVLDALKIDGWSVMIDPTTEVLEAVNADGQTMALAQLGISPGPDMLKLLNRKALEYAQTRSAELVGMRNIGTLAEPDYIVNPNAEYAINESTREMLRASVSDAIEQGLSTNTLRQSIIDNQAFSVSRAETIARTETAMADINGNVAAYKATGLDLEKKWLLGSEHDEDDECDDAADDGWIPFDQDFSNGLPWPIAHPRCVCDFIVRPVGTEDDKED